MCIILALEGRSRRIWNLVNVFIPKFVKMNESFHMTTLIIRERRIFLIGISVTPRVPVTRVYIAGTTGQNRELEYKACVCPRTWIPTGKAS